MFVEALLDLFERDQYIFDAQVVNQNFRTTIIKYLKTVETVFSFFVVFLARAAVGMVMMLVLLLF